MTRFTTSDGLVLGIGAGSLPGLRMEAVPGELEPLVRAAAEPGFHRIALSSFAGILLPYHIHNLNNILVGVLGNAELACMFLPGDPGRAIPKVRETARAAGEVTGFLRELSECTQSSVQPPATGSRSLKPVAGVVSLACGRSVDSRGLQKLESFQLPGNRDGEAGFAALLGMGVWSVLCLGGVGRVDADRGGDTVRITWERPSEAGEPMLPGCGMALQVACVAGGLAGRAGLSLSVRTDSYRSGWASLEGSDEQQ